MKFNPEIHHRRSIRLKNYDYSRNGAYFVTMCSWNREFYFGEISSGKLILNRIGFIISETWAWLGRQYPYLELMDFVIMPNHLHGILLVDKYEGGSRTAPTQRLKPLGRTLGAFKTRSTKLVNEYRQSRGLSTLRLDERISQQSRFHSEAMAQGSATFSHDGFDQRIDVINNSIPYRGAAENLAYNQGYDDPVKVAVEGWIDSPGHHKNMIGDFELTGVGVARNDQGEYYMNQIFIKQ